MKKKYTTPGIAKVELKPEQAVLGTCFVGAGTLSAEASRGCHSGYNCRQSSRNGGDSGNTS